MNSTVYQTERERETDEQHSVTDRKREMDSAVCQTERERERYTH